MEVLPCLEEAPVLLEHRQYLPCQPHAGRCATGWSVGGHYPWR
jgi:hypothetical protein